MNIIYGDEHLKILSLVLNVTNKLKPVLVKIIPIEFLRKAKEFTIKKAKKINEKTVAKKFDKSKYPQGINLIGFIRGEIGLGQSCRLVAKAIDCSDVDFTVYNYEEVSSMSFNDTSFDDKITNTTPYGVNVFHLNPPDLIIAKIMMDSSVWDYKYNIGFWLWELENFPKDWQEGFELVDEIWTPSDYITNIIKKQTQLPVKTMVYPIQANTSEEYSREYFKLPTDKFLYLTMYDCNSTMQRKNPEGSIRAYRKAFDNSNRDVGLVIKVNNPRKQDIDKIKELCSGYDNVYIIADTLSKTEVNSLIKEVDVLISLHRAEGFGLPLAEAMILGTATIGTNWSSNTEFMNEDNSCLVSYKMTELKEDYAMYKKGSFWADPDVDDAAEKVKKLYEDKAFYQKTVNNAKAYMNSNYDEKTAGDRVTKRIKEIYEN